MTYEEFNENIDALWTQTKEGKLPRAERFVAIEALIDSYITSNGRRPDSSALDRLSSLCLYEEITDERPDKMTLEESPILSETQRNRRIANESSFKLTEEYGTDGQWHKLPLRNSRK